jgi:putative ABC transport system permease protein
VLRVAIKGLLIRKFRASLTAIAIVLGVSMVSGTLILTDTISKAFNGIFVDSRSRTDVVISGEQVLGGTRKGATIPAALLARVREIPEVAAAAGTIEDSAKVVGKKGKVIQGFSPTLGFGLDFRQPRFFSWRIAEGRWPRGPNEVVVDVETADKQGFRLGQRIGVSGPGAVQAFRLTGVAKFGELESLGGATAAIFDIRTAQRLFRKVGRLDSISVAAQAGVTPDELVRRVEPVVPASSRVRTGVEQANSDADTITDELGFLRYFLLAFAGVAVFVGAFVIFNTFSITVAQRTREFATLRTLGAFRRQVLQSVVVEAFVIGLVASTIGLFAGLALAKGLTALLSRVGIDMPQTGTVFALRTIAISLAVGTVVAVLAGLPAALRATRVAPILAVREGAVLPPSRAARYFPVFAAVLVAAAVALLAYGMLAGNASTVQRFLLLAPGCLLLFGGIALVTPYVIRPLASVVGRPSGWLGGMPGKLARRNSTRSPGRTAATASALMIGLALVTFVAVLGEGLRASTADAIEEQVEAEYVVGPQAGDQPYSVAAGDAVARSPRVEVASSVRGEAGRLAGSDKNVTGVEPSTITRVFRFRWVDGDDSVLRRLGSAGALVTSRLADDKGLGVGSRVELVTPDGTRRRLRVLGTYKAPALGSLLGDVTIAQAAFDQMFRSPQNRNTYIDVRGNPGAETLGALERALARFPDAKVQTRSEFVESQQSQIKLLLNLLYVLLALSVVVSLFGMVNTLALSIVERTRELGMLRAVGMTRRQARRMVRHESVITALIGAALGLPLGLFLALLVTRTLEDEGIAFAVPALSLLVFAVAAIVAGVLAAILPARRAARLEILRALQYE